MGVESNKCGSVGGGEHGPPSSRRVPTQISSESRDFVPYPPWPFVKKGGPGQGGLPPPRVQRTPRRLPLRGRTHSSPFRKRDRPLRGAHV
jgi:hypothetical protein